MHTQKDQDELTQKIVSTSGKSREEVVQLINRKKEKFSGLLTDSGAAFMIAKELGVELEREGRGATKISELKEGMNNVDLVARVKAVFPLKEFEKNGRKGKLRNLILWDGSGEIRATLWNSEAEKFGNQKISRGACLKFTNCSISSYNGALQLGMNYNSSFAKTESTETPEIRAEYTNITDLDAGMNDVSVKVKIKKLFEPREFENERGRGKVMNFFAGEGVNEIRATAWNEMVDEVESVGEGENAVIEGAYTKKGRDGIELHLGWNARVIKWGDS